MYAPTEETVSDVSTSSLSETETRLVMSYEANMIFGAYLVIIGVLGTVGNTAVVVMFWKDKQLTSSVDVLLLNLSLSDLGMSALCFPFVSASSFAERWLFGNYGCTVYGYFGFLFGNVAICSLTAISVQRYLVVCRRHSNDRRAKTNIGLAVIWLMAFIWSSAPLFLPQPGYGPEPFQTSCSVAWASTEPNTRVYIYCLVFWVVGHFVVLTACYVSIYVTSRRELTGTTSRCYQDLLVSKICFVLVTAFVVCWFPYTVFSLLYSGTGTTSPPPAFTAIPVAMAKLSSCINPVVYIVVSQRFRQRYLDLIRCRKEGPAAVTPAAQPSSQSDHTGTHYASSLV